MSLGDEISALILRLNVRINDLEERIEALEQFELDYKVNQQIEYEKGHMQ